MKGTATSMKCIRIFTLFLIAALCAVSLVGCGLNKQHKMVTQECEECIKKGVEYYEVEDPISAVKCGGTLTIKANEPVYLCNPAFTTENGLNYTPYPRAIYDMEEGEVTISLRPGVYALCLDRGDSSLGKVVVVSEDYTQSPVIEMK